MKKKLVLFFSLFILMCSFVSGCSNNIKKIEIIEDSIRRNYVVGEEISINAFEIKVTYSNDKEEFYYVNDEKLKLSNIDNTVLGEQKLNIAFSYNNVDVNMQLLVNFNLPENVSNLISEIDSLPSLDNLNFDYESIIENLMLNYNSLSDFYKQYITNYNKLEECDLYLKELRNTYFTDEFFEYRSNVKLSLNKYYSTLNKSDYYDAEWLTINNIYNYGVNSLMNDNNYNKIESIYDSTINNIRKVDTAYLVLISNIKKDYINKIKEYRYSLNDELYSDDNVYKLNYILDSGITLVENSVNEENIIKNYNSIILELDEVFTIEEENKLAIENKIKENIYELNVYYISIDFSKYSASNKNNIRERYSLTVNKINNATDEESMKNYITYFKNYINLLYTIEEEDVILLENYKKSSISYLKEIYNNVKKNSYSTYNSMLIEKQFNLSLDSVQSANSISEVDEEIEYFANYISRIPTMSTSAY